MSTFKSHSRTRAQESTQAIERLYVTMRHLFNRGFYKPMGVSGESLRESLLILQPEIYGSINEDKLELQGLLYVMDRLPDGIEECRYINLTSEEGYKNSHFQSIIPLKRRRNCYRIDAEQMNIEITRGRSEIYDILTHLTFLFIESHKIRKQILLNENGEVVRNWKKLEKTVLSKEELTQEEKEVTLTYTANFLGRTFEEVKNIFPYFASEKNENRFFNIVYFLGKLAIEELISENKRIITFSPVLRERLGHHIHGEIWAQNIKKTLYEHNLLNRPLHIISANMHSVMNSLYASEALPEEFKKSESLKVFETLSSPLNENLRQEVIKTAIKEGMIFVKDFSGTNIDVQLIDTAKVKNTNFFNSKEGQKTEEKPVLIVMDYAFGEQAYEVMDELLRPYTDGEQNELFLDVNSVSIMGKAGILEGGKGDIMIPTAHVFEGTADNYPFENEFSETDFEEGAIQIFSGTMISVLGTSLQNKDVLKFFHESTWNVIGLEMEGAHYQKAIQAASKIRGSIRSDVKVRYAYYASDNPLETGSTLASGGLGTTGVKPTYLITEKILKQIFDTPKN